MDKLNIFTKYIRKENHYEDQLTHAFLTLLDYSVFAQILFINYIKNELKQKKVDDEFIPSSSIEGSNTFKEIRTQINTSRVDDYEGRLIAILITDEQIDYNENKIASSERKGVLDGLIETDDGYILTIENKPRHTDVWFDQLSFKFPEGLEHEEKPVILLWKNIIKGLNDIMGNSMISFIEKKLIEQFLLYVDTHWSFLNPFDKLSMCKDDEYLIEKRLKSIMELLQLGNVSWHRGWHYSIKVNRPEIKEITLFQRKGSDNTDWSIELSLTPGDVMNQARHFYSNVKTNDLLKLAKKKWKIIPNFHFAYRSSGLLWANTEMPTEEYLIYWKEKVKSGKLNQVKKEDWGKCLKLLLSKKIMAVSDKLKFSTIIGEKGYPNLNLCPGIVMSYKWNKNEAVDMDDQDRFCKEVEKKIQEAFKCWA